MNHSASRPIVAGLAVLLLLGLALAAGCSSNTPGPTATATPTHAGTAGSTAAGTTVTTAGTQGSGAGASTVVSYDRIIPFLPTAAGAWKLDGEPRGMTMKDAGGKDYTFVSADYAKDGSDQTTASVIIQDAANADAPYRQQWGSFRSYESTDGWWRQNSVQGQPGWKFHDKSSNSYDQWVFVGDRFIVYTSVDEGTEADLDALVNAMNLGGLAAVK